jgi:hypothetical protein
MSHLSLSIHGKILMKYFINYVGVTLASLFCNKARRDSFRLLFREFFSAVQRVTGHALNFHLFTRGASELRCFIFDAEAAQMQAFGDTVLGLNDSQLSGIETDDPLELVQHVAKTCTVHFSR